MSWAQLKLGSIDLAGSGYNVLLPGDRGMKVEDKSRAVAFQSSDGGRLSYGRYGPNERGLHIEVSGGGNIATAEANRDAIIAELIAARNFPRTGTVKTYIEQVTGGTAYTYKILFGSYEWTYTLQHVAHEIEMMVTLHLSQA